jgi:hypothetical protein
MYFELYSVGDVSKIPERNADVEFLIKSETIFTMTGQIKRTIK